MNKRNSSSRNDLSFFLFYFFYYFPFLCCDDVLLEYSSSVAAVANQRLIVLVLASQGVKLEFKEFMEDFQRHEKSYNYHLMRLSGLRFICTDSNVVLFFLF